MELLGKVRDRSVGTSELLQNAASGGIPERSERGIEAGSLILNHTVKYATWGRKHARGGGTIAVMDRYGTISEDLVEREAQKLVQYRAQAAVR